GAMPRQEKFGADIDIKGAELIPLPGQISPEELAEKAKDAEYVIIDAIGTFTAAHMDAMPKLKLIHSEGVGYNGVDIKAAAERGIFVCNNKGANASAVAEHTVMMMLALARDVLFGFRAVLEGRQIETKSAMMKAGVHELSEFKIGLIGFGDIAKEVVRMLRPFGPEVFFTVARQPRAEELATGAKFLERDELLAACDIVSLHLPVTPQTAGMVDREFLAKMKDGAMLINTSRGELMVNADVIDALRSGKLLRAAFDTIAPEPVLTDNEFLNMPEELGDRVLFTPHIAGVTINMFRKAYRTIWDNIFRVANGEEPVNWVNK
ncbi:MAG: hydroxyacid dehydrogenase, partial [Firmicutes bacterium]|nr:hydroxyacid dehydrogenase [Bacillota bacterium]